jgi:hypothetical protein
MTGKWNLYIPPVDTHEQGYRRYPARRWQLFDIVLCEKGNTCAGKILHRPKPARIALRRNQYESAPHEFIPSSILESLCQSKSSTYAGVTPVHPRHHLRRFGL